MSCLYRMPHAILGMELQNNVTCCKLHRMMSAQAVFCWSHIGLIPVNRQKCQLILFEDHFKPPAWVINGFKYASAPLPKNRIMKWLLAPAGWICSHTCALTIVSCMACNASNALLVTRVIVRGLKRQTAWVSQLINVILPHKGCTHLKQTCLVRSSCSPWMHKELKWSAPCCLFNNYNVCTHVISDWTGSVLPRIVYHV